MSEGKFAQHLTDLRRPFTPAAVKFKIQTKPKDGGKAMIVAFVNARLVSERLNAVVGNDWSDAYVRVHRGCLECHLTVVNVTRVDIGWGAVGEEGAETDIGIKSLYSSAFKRAAVKFGVGVSLYALPRMFVPANDLTQRGTSWFLPYKTENELRLKYAAWLKETGTQMFGDPLDHGDDTTPAEELSDEPTPAPPKPTASAEDIQALRNAVDKSAVEDADLLMQITARGFGGGSGLKPAVKALTSEQIAELIDWLAGLTPVEEAAGEVVA